ncbi:immunoglobulin domain-containing protein [Sediminicola sp. 1XM1-17]|uniref:immunoglobulin domain-containing protein n=1 Tax=Sediminicola sp. 1XM1-17 TaxID=3127702 RepID=UPI003077F560
MVNKVVHTKFWVRIGIFIGFVLLAFTGYSQQNPGVGANFGLEADLISGTTNANTDDWFSGATGMGVIDQSQFTTFQSIINSSANTPFDTRMSTNNFSSPNGYIWYAARFGHDYISEGNANKDKTTFGGGSKNAQNPATQWNIGESSLTSNVDIVDSYVHMRRNGTNTGDDLWVDLGVSTLKANGSRFIDFELYVRELLVSGGNFTNVGPNEGHTAWQFDATGNTIQIGDVVVGFAFSGSGVSGIEVRVWVSRADYLLNRGFNYTAFDGASNGSVYGYASINFTGNTFSKVNTVATTGPPWGTYATGLTPATSYEKEAFAEIGVNFTGIGFDPRTLFGPGSACDSPFSSVLVKTRSSASFTSSLSDFAGPYDFLGGSSGGQLDTSIKDPGNFSGCVANETLTLEANFDSMSAEYYWTSDSPGVTFPDGTTSKSGVYLTSVDIDTPGDYTLNIAPLPGCTPDPSNATTITVLEDLPVTVTSQPSDEVVCDGDLAQFNVGTANADTFQWQMSTDNGTTFNDLANGGLYSGATTSTLSVNPTNTTLDGYLYRLKSSTSINTCPPVLSDSAVLSVGGFVSIDSQPVDTNVFAGDSAILSVSASSANAYQWQVSDDNGVTFTDLTDGVNYSGVTTSSLTVSNMDIDFSGNQYRVIASNTSPACPSSETSSPATLTVQVNGVISNRRITHRVKKN